MIDVIIRTTQNVVTLQLGHVWGGIAVYRVCIGTLREMGHLEDLALDGRILLT
jgi:hypothetical protein